MKETLLSDALKVSHQSRRHFLSLCATTTILYLLPNPVILASNVKIDTKLKKVFQQTSSFLLNISEPNPLIATRILQALHDEDPQFIVNFNELKTLIADKGFSDVEAFKVSDSFMYDTEIRATTLKIIRAWYLGYTGERQTIPINDKTQFITYTEALMYKPTENSLPIPSYVKWGTNYWANPPQL